MFVPLVLPPSEWYCSWPVNISYLVSLPWMKGRKFNPGVCLTTHFDIQISTCKLCWLLHIRNDHSVEATVFMPAFWRASHYSIVVNSQMSTLSISPMLHQGPGGMQTVCVWQWDGPIDCSGFGWWRRAFTEKWGASCTGWGGLCDPQGNLCSTCICWMYWWLLLLWSELTKSNLRVYFGLWL